MAGPFFIGILVVLVLTGIILGAIYSSKAAKQRRLDLAELARGWGWSFDLLKDPTHDERYAHFSEFCQGHSRAAYNTLRGSMLIQDRQYPAIMGDYTYKVTSSNGKSTTTTTYHFSYLIVHLPFAMVPELTIRKEGFFDKIAGAIGFNDIDFESAEFSRRFMVKSSDKKFAYDVITAQMMEYLLAGEPPRIEISHNQFCLIDGAHRWEPQRFASWHRWTGSFFELWPDHVLRRLEERA